jgi:2-oxoglutarate dehydrogenase E1 component
MIQSLADQLATTALSGGNAGYIEDLYEQFLIDPEGVDPTWRETFRRLKNGAAGEIAHSAVRERLLARLNSPVPTGGGTPPITESGGASAKQGAVSRLIQVYANRGHLIANLDPLGLQERAKPYVLDLEYFGLSEADLDTEFFTGSRNQSIPERAKLRNILADLKFIYTDTIGAEFAHVSDTDERLWLQDHFQLERMQRRFSVEEKKNILWQLTAAEGLERYLHTKYVGQKRFSLEGGDSLIPLLDDLVQQGGKMGVEEAIIAMAHRGRLNVLVNVLGKSPKDLFSEFEGQYDLAKLRGSGDVKYHKGFSSDLKTASGNVHVALAFNPSHLEVVNAVVEGSVRARQERRGDALGDKVLAVQIHGDAAFAGQGVIMETLQLSQARGFYTGGSVHVIVNNQVGFTTSDPRDARSTLYCSDVAKMIEAPILHVNADDPEAVCFVIRFALEYRMKFHKDVVIDLVCYRRHGHNEADEPAATQPLMYQIIRKKPTARQLYAEKLAAEGVLGAADAAAMMDQYRAGLDEGKPQARAALGLIGNKYTVDWSEYLSADWEPIKTAVDMARLRAPRGLAAASAGSRDHAVARTHDERGSRPRLGRRREPGLCQPRAGRLSRAPHRPGQRARHVFSSSRRAARPAHGTDLRALAAPRHQPAHVHRDRLGLVRRSRHGIRVRLLHHRAALPDHLGRPIRRLLQWRPGDHRSIHQLRRSQMGTAVRPLLVPAARLRRPGTRALLRAPGALSAALRRVQHAGVHPIDAGADVSHAAPSNGALAAQAPHRDDAEEFAAPPLVGIALGGTRDRRLLHRHR